ncbi:MAG: acetate/propionate family kinase [Candidatus Dormibacteria bacterium]
MRLLTLNAGSSSLKLRVVADGDRVVHARDLSGPGSEGFEAELKRALVGLGALEAVVHRVVHGGGEFKRAVLLDATVETRLRQFADRAPLHQAPALEVVRATRQALPDLPQVACFDTAFHDALPAESATLPLPLEWRRAFSLRRYGFHGLSHAYLGRRALEILGVSGEELRLVTCHLGSGASLCAQRGGLSVDTTMGFTPMEGMVMATRPGSLDPGLVLWLSRQEGIDRRTLDDGLERRSGLKGLAQEGEMRQLLARREQGDAEATLALGVYLHRLRQLVAAMAAALGGLDGLVFSGGVGENSWWIRETCCQGLGFLGVGIDSELNRGGEGDRNVGDGSHPVAVLVLASREELQMALECRRLLQG